MQRYGSTWQLAHPNYELFDTEDTDAALGIYAGGLVPVYLHVPKLDSWAITKSVRIVFDHLDEVDDPVPAAVRRKRGLVPLLEAYRLVHLPRDRADVRRGEHRLRYDEAFTVQAILAQRRRANDDVRTTARRPRPGGLLESFDKRLPFELTAGQVAVSEQIAAELALEHPMHRLLQGEVGSGKTIVALRAMLSVIDSGGQAALLAPTEVLAAQHFRSMRTMLGDLAEGGMLGGSDVGTQVALLTGSQPTAVRRKALLDAASGDAGIVIGTHALIQEHVSFFDLGLVVVDEQHRFGVEQRDALRSKGSQPPHVLVMTATPIPRTVAMTVFGDLETSTLTELPARAVADRHARRAGGQPRVGAAHVAAGRRGGAAGTPGLRRLPAHRRRRAGGRLRTPVRPRRRDGRTRTRGRRPQERLPADGDGDDAGHGRSASCAASWASSRSSRRAVPAGLRVEVLHGRMAPEDKDAVMQAFAAGEVDVLVATTVIEVGVDVPNATVMVVMDAERFGVSQLHQLRGRVGRGAAPGLCLLITEAEPGPSLRAAGGRRRDDRRVRAGPRSTSSSAARATCSAPRQSGGRSSCGCCACCATRT